MTKIPEGPAYRAEWGKLDAATRRRIVRAVNKGEALEKRREAALAVATARRQQRFWKRAWLIGPIAALITVNQGIVAYAANAVLSTAIIGLMGLWWYRRAERAAALNLEAAEGRRRKPPQQQRGKPNEPKRGGHLPGRD